MVLSTDERGAHIRTAVRAYRGRTVRILWRSRRGERSDKGIEKTAKTRSEITTALKQAFQYCENAYAGLNDAKAAETVKFFGMTITRLGAMDFNVAHNMEHYGNLVTYMRLKNIVPPSSAARPPAAKK